MAYVVKNGLGCPQRCKSGLGCPQICGRSAGGLGQDSGITPTSRYADSDWTAVLQDVNRYFLQPASAVVRSLMQPQAPTVPPAAASTISSSSWTPWLLIGGALVAVVLVMKK